MSKITVIIPYFNADFFVEEALLSITTQSFKDVIIFIINDGSTVESRNKLNEIVKKFTELSIEILDNPQNLGVALTRNRGISLLSSEYFLTLDADDMLCGKYNLETRINFLDKNPDFSGIAGYTIKINQDSKIIYENILCNQFFIDSVHHPKKLLYNFCQNLLENSKDCASTLFFFSAASVFRTEDVKNYLFDPNFEKEEDVEWLLRVLKEKRVSLQMIPFVYRREHENQYHLNTPSKLVEEIKEKCKTILASI